MGTYNYFWKDKTPDQKFGLTQYVCGGRIVVLVGHGQGECNSGDLAGCKFSSGWGGWYWIKILAELLGFDLIFLNTTLASKYSLKEYQFALEWVKKKYPEDVWKKNVWVLGHSLGSYGAGKYAFIEFLQFANQIAGWIVSASGNYGINPIANLFKMLVDAGCCVFGVTAVNDTVSGTTPLPTTQLYPNMKALNANAKVIISEFPATEWPNDYPPLHPTGSKAAHNNVLGRITQKPIGVRPEITKGIAAGKPFRMNIGEWMISNPRGSVYQDPTLPFTGPIFDGPIPVPIPPPAVVYIKDLNWTFKGDSVLIAWRDGSPPDKLGGTLSDGRIISNIYDRVVSKDTVNERVSLTLTFTNNSTPYTIDRKSKFIS